MGSLIGEIVEGAIRGIGGAINRKQLGDSFIAVGEKIHRSEMVSDAAIATANATLAKLQNIRSRYTEG